MFINNSDETTTITSNDDALVIINEYMTLLRAFYYLITTAMLLGRRTTKLLRNMQNKIFEGPLNFYIENLLQEFDGQNFPRKKLGQMATQKTQIL